MVRVIVRSYRGYCEMCQKLFRHHIRQARKWVRAKMNQFVLSSFYSTLQNMRVFHRQVWVASVLTTNGRTINSTRRYNRKESGWSSEQWNCSGKFKANAMPYLWVIQIAIFVIIVVHWTFKLRRLQAYRRLNIYNNWQKHGYL